MMPVYHNGCKAPCTCAPYCLRLRLVVVFDADMCAKPEFFVRMLEVGHFAS
jgi:hypothetical protein